MPGAELKLVPIPLEAETDSLDRLAGLAILKVTAKMDYYALSHQCLLMNLK